MYHLVREAVYKYNTVRIAHRYGRDFHRLPIDIDVGVEHSVSGEIYRNFGRSGYRQSHIHGYRFDKAVRPGMNM